MIVQSLRVPATEFEARTGWAFNERGACKGDVCIPVAPETVAGGHVDIPLLAEQLRMPIVHHEGLRLWSIGPVSGGKALTTAVAPPLALPDLDGTPFELSSLRGKKVLLLAWASW
jgi:hypothetical protein